MTRARRRSIATWCFRCCNQARCRRHLHNLDVSYASQPLRDPSAEPPVGEPYFGVPFSKALKRFFTGYVTFKGRASRSEFWFSFIWIYIVLALPSTFYLVAGVMITMSSGLQTTTLDNPSPADQEARMQIALWALPVLLVAMAMVLPFLAVMSRRLHDAGFSALFLLFYLAGLGIVPMIVCVMPTSPGALKYGPGEVPGPGPGTVLR